MKLILLINVKMPAIVGILTLISRINTKHEPQLLSKKYIFQHFRFYEPLNFHAHLKSFIIPGPGYIASRHKSFPLNKKMLRIFKCSMKKHDNAHSYRDQ